MKRMCIAVFVLFTALCPALFAQQYAAGKIIEEIRCKDDRDYSYLLYLPTSYTADRAEEFPVLFVMGAGGGKVNGLERYVLGAEKNQWILAMSTQSKNNYDKSHQAIEAMVEDVFDHFHADEKRCYASGMSGGGREAFWLAAERKKNIIGIIPCGAGGNSKNSKLLAYGLCGSFCFNRWDMATSFDEHFRKTGRLRFFPGGHVWAQEDLIFDAVTWLNAQYLNKEGSRAEVDQFSAMLLNEIKTKYENDPYFAYENAVVLAGVSKAPDAAKAKEIVAKLRTDPEIKAYIAGLSAMDEFVDDHFNTDVMDYINNPCTSSQRSDTAKLLSQYRDTPLAKTIEGFGQPCKKF